MTISIPIRAAVATATSILFLVFINVASAPADTAAPESAVSGPSALVATTPPQRGSIPDLVTTYGSVARSSGSTRNITLRREVEIRQLSVESGQSVRIGDALAEVETTPTAAAAYQQAVTMHALATAQRVHTAQLRSQQLATNDQLSQSTKNETDAQAQLTALKREGADRSDEIVKASCDGAVSTIVVAQGDRIQANAPLVTLECNSGAVVSVGLEPGDEARVSKGQKARLEPLSQGSAIDGTVGAVGGMIDPKTHLVPSIIRTAAPLLNGASYRALITVGNIIGWLVPRDAVLSDEQGFYVFEITGKKAHRVEVKPAGTLSDTTVVAGALDPSRPIVTSGNHQLEDGMAVRMTQDGAN